MKQVVMIMCVELRIERRFSDKEITLSFTVLSTDDIENVIMFITCCSIKQWKKLQLNYCYIQDTGLHIMHRIITQSSVTIKELWLNDNELSSSSDSCLTDIVISCRVKVLDISKNKTIGQTVEFFPTILYSPSSVIEELYIHNINLSARAAIVMFTLLKKEKTKLKRLGMAYNHITDDTCDVIAETLRVNSLLEYLDIYGNKISTEALQLILNSLRHNNTLTQLNFPGNYSEDDKKQILMLQDIVNEERKHRRCQVKLNVAFHYL